MNESTIEVRKNRERIPEGTGFAGLDATVTVETKKL